MIGGNTQVRTWLLEQRCKTADWMRNVPE